MEGRGLGSRKGKVDPSYRAWSLDAGASQGLVRRLPGGRRAKRLQTMVLKCKSSSLSQVVSKSLLHTQLWISVVLGGERMGVGFSVVWLMQKKACRYWSKIIHKWKSVKQQRWPGKYRSRHTLALMGPCHQILMGLCLRDFPLYVGYCSSQF